jgi:hypothetical protein
MNERLIKRQSIRHESNVEYTYAYQDGARWIVTINKQPRKGDENKGLGRGIFSGRAFIIL